MSAFVPIIEAPDENRGLFGIIGSNTSLIAVFGSDTPETYTHYYAESGGVRSGSNFGFLVGVSNELFTIRSGLDSASNASSSAYMTSNGFFGLGTDDPKERLHVAGNMVLDGKIFDGFGSEIVLGGGGGGENGSWRKLDDDSDYHPTISAPDTGVFQTTCNVILQHYFGNDMILNLNIDGTVITRPSPPGGDYTMNLPVFMDVTSYPIETTVGELWLTTSSNNGPRTIFKALAKSIPGSNESIAIRYLTGTTEVSLANINSGMEISLQGIVRYQTVLYNIITAEDSITIPGDTMKWMPIREPHPMFAAPLGGSSTTLLRQGLMRYLGDELIYRVLFEATLDSQPSSSVANARDYTISLEYPIAPQAYINSNAIIGDLWLTVINETTATNFKAYARTVDGDTSKVAIRFLNGTFDQSLAEIDAGSTIRIQGNIVYKAEQVASLAIPRAYLPNNLYQDNDGNVALNNYGRPMRARFEIIETSNLPALIVDQHSDADIAQFRSNVDDIKLIIDSRGHIGVGTTIAPYPFTVKGGMLFDGTMYDATGNAIWIPGSSVNWKATATAPVITVPTGGVWTQLPGASKGIWRYMGNEINYNVTISGVLSVASTDEEDDFRLSIPYPINRAAYLPESIIGDLWADVIYGANSNTFKAYARPDPADSNQVRLRVLSGTKDDSLATLLAGSALTIKGEVKYSTNNQVQSINPYGTYDPLDLQQDVSGQVILNGYGNLPRARLDIVSGPDASTSNALVLDQRGTGNSLIVMNQGIPKTIFDSAGHIGIGTLAPLAELHVEGNIYAKGNIKVSNDSSGPALLVNQESSCNILQLERSGIVKLNVLENGFVGIGTSVPQQQLHMTGSARIDGGASIGSGLIMLNQGIPTTTIDSAGHIGIGTTTPSHALDVRGNAFFGAKAVTSANDATRAIYITPPSAHSASNIAEIQLEPNEVSRHFVRSEPAALTMGGNTTIRVSANDHDGLASNVFEVRKNDAPTLVVAANGDLLPGQTNVYNLGSQTTRWSNMYTSNIRAQSITATGDLSASNIQVTNDGTGPAIKVTQTGNNSIAEFYDDANAVALMIANGGSIGIGTAVPQSALDVIGSVKATSSISSDTQFLGQANDTAIMPSFSFAANPNTGIFQPATSNIALSTGGIERLRVSSNGFVGIGTAVPQSALDVIGSLKATTSISCDTQFLGQAADTESAPSFSFAANPDTGIFQPLASNIALSTGGTERVRVSSNGFVGIGTAAPQSALHVIGSTSITSNLVVSGNITASNIRVLGDYVILDTITSNTEQMVITNDGTGPALRVTQTGNNSIAEFYDGDGGAGGILAMKIANDGLVGIGTATPQSALHVVGSAKVTSSISSDTQFLGQAADTANAPSFSFVANPNTGIFQPAASNLAVSTGGTERMRVLANGNVGIGTATPQSTLHVNGSALISTNLTVSGGDIKTSAAVSSTLFSDTTTGSIAIGGGLTTGTVTLGATGSTGDVSMFPATGAQAITLGGATSGLIALGSTTASAVQLPTGKTKVGTTALVQGGAVSVTLPAIAGTLIVLENALTSGAMDTGFLKYNGTTATAGQLDGGTATPTGTTRLNYGGYIYPTQINLVGTGDTATAATHYFVETGSDGFVRPKTLANARTEIVTTAAVNSAAATTVGTITSGVWNAGAVTSSGNVSAGAQVLAPSGDVVGTPGFSWTGNTGTGIYRPAVNVMGIVTNGIERMRVDASGNVGINTTNPQSKLHVEGEMRIAGQLGTQGTPQAGKIYVGGQNNDFDNQYIVFPNPSTTDANGMAWWSSDMVFGRFKNTFRLALKETHGGSLGSALKDIITANIVDSGGYNNVTSMTLSGDVGIGTTIPQAKLHVNGNVFGSGLVIQCVTVVFTDVASYTAPTTITPTSVSALNITITPKRTTSKIVLQWMVNGESGNNIVYVVYRNETPIGFNTSTGNTQQSGVTSAPYDTDGSSTPYNITVTWVDNPNTIASIVYSVRVRSSTTAAADTLQLGRTGDALIGEYRERMCNTGIAWEISS
jgi:hypothetical protein